MIFIAAIGMLTLLVLWLTYEHERERGEWREERRELLNRIQHPEIIPTTPAVNFKAPEIEPDLSELVGTIHYEAEDE